MTQEEVQDIIGAMVTGNVETNISVTYDDATAKLNFVATGAGDVVGPAGATDHAVARWDTATGKLLQDSVVIIDDAGAITGVTTLVASGAVTVDDLLLYDTNASHTLLFHWNEDEAGANRTLNWIVGGADKTVTLQGDPTLDDWFDQGVKITSGPTFDNLTVTNALDIGSLTTIDVIQDLNIDWGTGANQVSAVDMPIADGGTYFTGTEVETGLQELGKTDELVNGTTLRPISLSIASAAGVITASLSSNVGNTITFKFSGGLVDVDVTAPKTATLTAGTDTVPVENYLYVLAADPTTLVANTTGFPAATDLCTIGIVICQSAASLETDGPLKQHTWGEDVANDAGRGHISHINSWMRYQWSTWLSGVAPTFSGTGTGTIGYASTSGTVRQLHKLTFPQFADPAVVYCVNDPDTAYRRITNIGDLLKDSAGVALTNKTYALVFWGALSDDGQSKIYCNLPSGSQNNEVKARQDKDREINYSIPTDFKGVGFLIYRLLIKNNADTTWTLYTGGTGDDLRGQYPATSAGSSTALGIDFPDGASGFTLYNVTDITKQVQVDLSGITTGNTRTLTFPDTNVDFGDIATNTAHASSDGSSHTFIDQDVTMSAGPTFDDLLLYDTNASHTVTLHWNEDEAGANRIFNFVLGGADRTLTMNGDPTLDDWFDQSVKQAASPQLAGMAMTGYIDWTEIGAPANPAANVGRMYSKDNGGITTPYWLDSAGTETSMLGAGATGVTATAVIADHALTRGDGGGRGIQDCGWVMGDDDVLVAADNLDINDHDVINIKDLLPHDGELNIHFPLAGTAYIKGTTATQFNNATLDGYSGTLKAAWYLEDVTDSIDGYDLTNNNAVTFTAGKNNNAGTFVRGSSQYLKHNSGEMYDANNNFVLSCWLNLDDTTTSSLIAQYKLAGQNPAGQLYYTGTAYRWRTYTVGIAERALAWTAGTGSYVHVVIVRDGNTIYLYGDNVERDTVSVAGVTLITADTFLIGARDYGVIDHYMDGQVDEVYLWENISFADAAARVAFVAALNNTGSGRFLSSVTSTASLDVQDYIYVSNTGLLLADTDDSHELNIKWNENEAAADRTLNIIMGGADRTLDMTSLATGDVTAAANMTDHSIIRGDDGAKGVQDTGILIDDSDNMTLPDGASLLLQEDITFTGATGENLVKFPDDQLHALQFLEGSNIYMKFVSSNGAEEVECHKPFTVGGIADKVAAGTGVEIQHGDGGMLIFNRMDSTITDTETLGEILFYGTDPAPTGKLSAKIMAVAKGAWDTDDYPSELQFYTTPAAGAAPVLGMTLDKNGNLVVADGTFFIKEQAAAETDVAAYGQFWVKDDAPNIAKFTDDDGSDFNLVGWSLIAETIVGAGGAASVDFQNIPATYTHLTILGNVRTETASDVDSIVVRLNNDSGNNYNWLFLQWAGDTAYVTPVGTRADSSMLSGYCEGANAQADAFSTYELMITNYANANMDTDIMSRTYTIRENNADNELLLSKCGGHWNNTAAVTRVTVIATSTDDIAEHSKISLYGIK